MQRAVLLRGRGAACMGGRQGWLLRFYPLQRPKPVLHRLPCASRSPLNLNIAIETALFPHSDPSQTLAAARQRLLPPASTATIADAAAMQAPSMVSRSAPIGGATRRAVAPLRAMRRGVPVLPGACKTAQTVSDRLI